MSLGTLSLAVSNLQQMVKITQFDWNKIVFFHQQNDLQRPISRTLTSAISQGFPKPHQKCSE